MGYMEPYQNFTGNIYADLWLHFCFFHLSDNQ